LIADSVPETASTNSAAKKKQKRLVQNLYDEIEAIGEVLKEEYDETMNVRKRFEQEIEELEKKIISKGFINHISDDYLLR